MPYGTSEVTYHRQELYDKAQSLLYSLWLAQKRPGHAHQLPLPHTEVAAVLSHRSRQTAWSVGGGGDKAVGLGRLAGGDTGRARIQH